jgi:hypothetical protein
VKIKKKRAVWLERLRYAKEHLRLARAWNADKSAVAYWEGAVKHAKHMLAVTKKVKTYGTRKKSYGR